MSLVIQGQQANPEYLYGWLSFDTAISDPLAGTVNNLSINGGFFASQYNLRASDDVTLTGIANGTPGKLVTLVNESTFTITLASNDAGSDAANRFAAAATIAAGTSLQLTYSAELALWVPAAGNSSGGGVGPVVLSSVLTPAALDAGDNDDYTTTGIDTASVVRFTPNAANSTLTGIVAPTVAQQIVIYNIAAGELTFAHNVTSTPANRFLCPGNIDYTVIENGRAVIWYDLTSARWRVQ